MEEYRSGHNGPDSKSGWVKAHVGSNPTSSAEHDALMNVMLFMFDSELRVPVYQAGKAAKVYAL